MREEEVLIRVLDACAVRDERRGDLGEEGKRVEVACCEDDGVEVVGFTAVGEADAAG